MDPSRNYNIIYLPVDQGCKRIGYGSDSGKIISVSVFFSNTDMDRIVDGYGYGSDSRRIRIRIGY